MGIGRLATWMVLAPSARGLAAWSRLRPPQQLVLGFLSYAILGTVFLSCPWATKTPVAFVDNLFNVTSAISTTGLTTISVSDSYTFTGQLGLLVLFQLGGIGYMTLSSVIILARWNDISPARVEILRTGFSLPRYFVMSHFVVQVLAFTVVTECVGAAVLWARFSALGLSDPLWSAVFHSVSAFATAGFSLYNNSLESFRGDWIVNLTVGALCVLGGVGFIVMQDVWYSIKLRERMLTFTSKVILSMTGAVFIVGTVLMYFLEPTLEVLPPVERAMAAAFQVMSASSTAGFNSVPIGALSKASLMLISLAMIIGASPSGTGGGIKTTTVSAILANLISMIHGRGATVLMSNEIPLPRVRFAFASATQYLILLVAGTYALCIVESHEFLPIVFEAASAIGTVGLSMGITSALTTAGKYLIVALMFAGRCGPLTLGLALVRPQPQTSGVGVDDLAV